MANRLADATSPYLLQHAENPVEWWPWCPEAFAEARRRDIPVLLSIGYAACHWCHVMAHESFEDSDIAAKMNENFVNIKVDREERPDVDAVYMEATQAMTGQGGWPMTCFLTPAGEPFHCGTYYPASPHPGMPSFPQLLDAVATAWRDRGDEVREAAGKVVQQLSEHTRPLPEAPVDDEVIDSAVDALSEQFDEEAAGFGSAPKFPPSMVLEFLLRHHERRGDQGRGPRALRMAEATASAMARGGVYDQLGGGFARYSVDRNWVVPHFEKMLYDNALLLRSYAHLARRGGGELVERVTRETAEFLLRDLRTPQGGFASSLDADTNGVEGLSYVWTPDQLVEELGESDGGWAAELFGVTEAGTFEHGSSTLRLPQDPSDTERWRRVRRALWAARTRRPQPGIDDKVVTAWNGLAITALAEAGEALGEGEWIAAARESAELVLSTHRSDGRLLRSSRGGSAGGAAAVLEDYGCFAEGLLALHQATAEARWLEAARELLDTALERFTDGEHPGAFHDTASDAEELVRRPSDPTDNATPAGASSVTAALLAASVLVGPDRAGPYRSAAEQALGRAGLVASRAPRFAGHWLAAAEALRHGPLQVAVVGAGDDPDRSSLHSAALRSAPGGAVIIAGEPADGADSESAGASVPLLSGRPLVEGAAAAYVCRGYVCDRPVTSSEEVATALGT